MIKELGFKRDLQTQSHIWRADGNELEARMPMRASANLIVGQLLKGLV